MPYHDWGGKDFDWKSLDRAAYLVQNIIRTYGRGYAHAKEKWGNLRCNVYFGGISLHSLIYPSYHYSQFPNWLWKLDIDVISPVLQFFFEKLWIKWQQKVYRYAYVTAVRKYPHIAEEIISDADYPELLPEELQKYVYKNWEYS